MHKRLTLKNFRGFKDFSMDLKPVTLIAGKNNTGKTSILESIFILHYFGNPEAFLNVPRIRGIVVRDFNAQTIWDLLFHNMNTSIDSTLTISLDKTLSTELRKNHAIAQTGSIIAGEDATDFLNSIQSVPTSYFLECKFTDDASISEFDYFTDSDASGKPRLNVLVRSLERPPFYTKTDNSRSYFGPNVLPSNNEIDDWFGQVLHNNKKKKLIEALNILDNDVADIDRYPMHGLNDFYLTNNAGVKIPISIMGDGIRKIMHTALFLLSGSKKPLLLDEAENGLHHSLHVKFWEMISTLAIQENRQIIATTHSQECIEGALDGIKEANLEDDFAFVRLDKSIDGRQVVPKMFTSAMLERALDKDREVR